MIEQIKAFLYANWGDYFPHMPKPIKIRVFLTYGSYGSHCKATFLLFADENIHPFCVVKTPFFGEGAHFIRREHEVVTRLYTENSRNSGLVIPRCRFIENFNGFPLLLLDAFNGSPFRKAIRHNRSHESLKIGIDWIARMHLMTRVVGSFTKEDYEELVAVPLRISANRNGDNPSIADSFQDLALRLETLIGKNIPWVCSHNDFRVSNLRIHEDALQVCDWEFASWPGLPMLDIMNFVVDYYTETSRASFARSFSYVFEEENQYSKEIHSHLKQYCECIGMEEALMPIWIDLFLIHKLYLAQQILFPLQVYYGLEWAKNIDKVILSRGSIRRSL